jgi:Tfp pilus assembly protein PilE
MRQPRAGRHRGRGVTIIELVTVLVVLGVLISLVVAPAIQGMIGRHRVQGVQAGLLVDLQLARSELAQHAESAASGVALTFGGNADVTCYLIHTVVDGVVCDCTRAPACQPAGAQEIKSMQFARAAGVSVAASSPLGSAVTFAPPQGLATPDGLVIDVQDATSGKLRTTVSGRGVPSVCSPDGSIQGVPSPC